MDDLTRCLYEFLLDRRMGRLWEHEEYQAYCSAVLSQEEQVRSCMDEAQQKELDLLLDRIGEQDSFEKERLFQAALGLVRELDGLVSCSCQRPG